MLKQMSMKLSRYKMRNQFILVGIVLSLCMSITLSTAIYSLMVRDTTAQIGSNTLLSLKQTARMTSTLYAQVDTLMLQMFDDLDLQHYAYTTKEDKVITYHAMMSLQKILNVYPFVLSIELYNPVADSYFSSLRPNSTDMPQMHEATVQLYAASKRQRLVAMPRQIVSATGAYRYDVLSYVFRPNTTFNNNFMIIINVDTSYIARSILSDSIAEEGASAFILNGNDVVITHTQPSQFMADFSGEDYRTWFRKFNGEGYFIKTVDGERSLVSFAYSDLYDWYFVSIHPYQSLVAGLARTRNLVIVTSFVIFVLALLASVRFIRRAYNPFQRLLEDMGGIPSTSNDLDTLVRGLSKGIHYEKSSEQLSVDLFVQELLLGVPSKSLDDDIRQSLQVRFLAANYNVALLRIDNARRLKSRDVDRISLLQYNIIPNAISEVLQTKCVSASIVTGNDEIAVLCAGNALPDFCDVFQELTSILRELTPERVTMAVGGAVGTIEEVRSSFITATTALRYRIYMGGETFIVGKLIQPFLNNDAAYPYEIEHDILRDINANNAGKLQKDVARFGQALSAASCDSVKHYALQLSIAILRYMDEHAALQISPHRFIDDVDSADTIRGICDCIGGYCNEIWVTVKREMNSETHKEHDRIIEQIKERVAREYGNPNLSLESLSDSIGLSSEYLRKLFKQIHGHSFSHYLNQVRIDRSCDLLVNTDLPATIIGEQVGFLNTTYYFTVFKKVLGATPVLYRKRNREAEEELMHPADAVANEKASLLR